MIKNKVFSSEDRSDWRFRTWKSEFIKEKNSHINYHSIMFSTWLLSEWCCSICDQGLEIVGDNSQFLFELEDLPPTNLLGALKVICSGDGLQWFPFNLPQVLHKAGESLVKSFIFASAARRNFSFSFSWRDVIPSFSVQRSASVSSCLVLVVSFENTSSVFSALTFAKPLFFGWSQSNK